MFLLRWPTQRNRTQTLGGSKVCLNVEARLCAAMCSFFCRKKTVCQPRRALIASGVVLLCAITKNFHVFWTRGPEFTQGPNGTMVLKRNCGRPTAAYRYFEFYIRPWIAFALVNAVPFVALLVFNIAIIKYLAIAMRARRSNTEGQNASDKGFTQTVAMCLSASFTFLICMTPSMVLLIGRPYWSNNNPAYNIAKAVNNQLAYVNHSANIFLYCATGNFNNKSKLVM